jgi:Uma2 family endonuclease
MATAPNTSMSVSEYLQLEDAAEFRSEYIAGCRVAIPGGTLNHALISSNLIGELWNALRETDCKVFGSDMRIRTAPSGIYTYADAVVGCGKLNVVDNTLANPALIAEVLSELTEAYDRGGNSAGIARSKAYATTFSLTRTNPWLSIFTRSEKACGACGSTALSMLGCSSRR